MFSISSPLNFTCKKIAKNYRQFVVQAPPKLVLITQYRQPTTHINLTESHPPPDPTRNRHIFYPFPFKYITSPFISPYNILVKICIN